MSYGMDAYSSGGGGSSVSTYPSYLSSGYGYAANGGLKPAPVQAGAFNGGGVPAPMGGRSLLLQHQQQRGYNGSQGLNPVRRTPTSHRAADRDSSDCSASAPTDSRLSENKNNLTG